jgi:hypothetical protein
MINRLRKAVLLLALAVSCPQGTLAAPAAAPAKFDAPAFAATVQRAQAGDAGVDYQWLRQQQAIRDSYIGGPWPDFSRVNTLLADKPAEALRVVQARIAQNWADLVPHMAAQIALDKLGRADEAAREKGIVIALARSIAGGHHGKDAIDAFNAVTTGEEYQMLMLMGLKPGGQQLINQDGHSFDVMDTTDRTSGEKHTVWFNIDFFFGKEGGLDKLIK